MGYLVAAVVLVGLVVLFDVVVTVGLVRRLRAHSDLLAELVDSAGLLAVGTRVPEFSGESVDEVPVDRRSLSGPAAVAFWSVDCPHCQTNLPQFVAYVRGGAYPRERVLAVVAHDGSDSSAMDDMIGVLAPVATVAREALADGRITAAFSVRGFPTFYLVGADGTVTAAAHAVRALPRSAPAPTSAT